MLVFFAFYSLIDLLCLSCLKLYACVDLKNPVHLVRMSCLWILEGHRSTVNGTHLFRSTSSCFLRCAFRMKDTSRLLQKYEMNLYIQTWLYFQWYKVKSFVWLIRTIAVWKISCFTSLFAYVEVLNQHKYFWKIRKIVQKGLKTVTNTVCLHIHIYCVADEDTISKCICVCPVDVLQFN